MEQGACASSLRQALRAEGRRHDGDPGVLQPALSGLVSEREAFGREICGQGICIPGSPGRGTEYRDSGLRRLKGQYDAGKGREGAGNLCASGGQ